MCPPTEAQLRHSPLVALSAHLPPVFAPTDKTVDDLERVCYTGYSMLYEFARVRRDARPVLSGRASCLGGLTQPNGRAILALRSEAALHLLCGGRTKRRLACVTRPGVLLHSVAQPFGKRGGSMKEYEIVRRLLVAEQRRREGVYRYRPTERAAAMKEIGDALAALERMKKGMEWNGLARYWQEKFD